MSDPLMEAALAEAYASCPTDLVVLETVEINHPSFTDGPIRVVNDYVDLTATLETGQAATFVRFAFTSVKPEVNAAGVPEYLVTVDNATAEIARMLMSVSASPSPLTVVIRQYRSDDLTKPAGRLIPGEIRHVDAPESSVTIKIGFGQIANMPFPKELFTPRRFPGLVR